MKILILMIIMILPPSRDLLAEDQSSIFSGNVSSGYLHLPDPSAEGKTDLFGTPLYLCQPFYKDDSTLDTSENWPNIVKEPGYEIGIIPFKTEFCQERFRDLPGDTLTIMSYAGIFPGTIKTIGIYYYPGYDFGGGPEAVYAITPVDSAFIGREGPLSCIVLRRHISYSGSFTRYNTKAFPEDYSGFVDSVKTLLMAAMYDHLDSLSEIEKNSFGHSDSLTSYTLDTKVCISDQNPESDSVFILLSFGPDRSNLDDFERYEYAKTDSFWSCLYLINRGQSPFVVTPLISPSFGSIGSLQSSVDLEGDGTYEYFVGISNPSLYSANGASWRLFYSSKRFIEW